jgi:two-component system, OmpR family, phosphate regulon sensor histidine kinase PhoR
MKRITIAKLAGIWSLAYGVSLFVGYLWFASPQLAPIESPLSAALLLGLFCAGGFLVSWFVLRSWLNYAHKLEEFASALPAKTAVLPAGFPAEFTGLSESLRRMAAQVRSTVEHASQEAARRETILAGMAEGVLAVDERLNVVFYNEAFAHAFQARLPVAEGRPLYEVAREPALREILEIVVRSRIAAKRQFQLPSAAGHWFEAHALPFGDSTLPGAVVVLHDISDIQRTEQARKDFVANVSHELRTPLASIRGYAETLLDGALEDTANNRHFVEIILSQSIRLNNIASDLLVLSELDSNAPAVPPEHVPLLDVIESAIRTVESSAGLRQVRIVRGEYQECVVGGYRFRLEQALVNLLDNAVKFNKPDGEVQVECARTADGRIRVVVSDTGIGIPSEDLKRIFERFYRVDKARSRRVGGTGLGLSIVKEIIERMGGTISVESQLGRGTQFTILFPSS